MPREPPVTSAMRPLSENRSLSMTPPIDFAGGFGRGFGRSQGSAAELGGVDAAEAVPHGGRGTRGENGEDAPVLVIPVQRDPRQSRQIIRAAGKNHAGT